MSMILSLLQSLGINSTLWIQLTIFMLTFVIMNRLVFSPYFAAHTERHRRTLGGKEDASSLIQSNLALQSEYESRIRGLNDQIRYIFEKARTQALTDQANIFSKSREATANYVKNSRNKMEREVQLARTQLNQEIRELSSLVSSKLIGGDTKTSGEGASA